MSKIKFFNSENVLFPCLVIWRYLVGNKGTGNNRMLVQLVSTKIVHSFSCLCALSIGTLTGTTDTSVVPYI